MRKWKLRVQHCGLPCGDDDELLTNVRYADDLILYGRCDHDLAIMVDCLVEELQLLVKTKTKILTTENLNEPMFFDIGGDLIEVLRGRQNQKYLGKKLFGDLRKRALVDLQNRRQIAWMTFNEHGDTLLNRHVSLRLRLKLFDSVIIPTILFGLFDLSFDFESTSEIRSGEKPYATFNCWMGTLVGNDWHALMHKNEQKTG